MTPLKSQAVQTALLGNWKNAIVLNQELLKEDPNDIETLNRLAFAYSVVGKVKDARSVYQKVLAIDSQNPIALKNLKRLVGADKRNSLAKQTHLSPLAQQVDTMFLEESGKTKVVELINVAEPKVISHIMTGEFLVLRIKRLKIFVLDANDQYIGMLPDDIGKRLIKFMKAGNCYQSCAKSVENRRVVIFIKETKRVARLKHQPSFIASEKNKTGHKPSHFTKSLEDQENERDEKEEDF